MIDLNVSTQKNQIKDDLGFSLTDLDVFTHNMGFNTKLSLKLKTKLIHQKSQVA